MLHEYYLPRRKLIRPPDLRFLSKAFEVATAEADLVTALEKRSALKISISKKRFCLLVSRYRGYYNQKALAQRLNRLLAPKSPAYESVRKQKQLQV